MRASPFFCRNVLPYMSCIKPLGLSAPKSQSPGKLFQCEDRVVIQKRFLYDKVLGLSRCCGTEMMKGFCSPLIIPYHLYDKLPQERFHADRIACFLFFQFLEKLLHRVMDLAVVLSDPERFFCEQLVQSVRFFYLRKKCGVLLNKCSSLPWDCPGRISGRGLHGGLPYKGC